MTITISYNNKLVQWSETTTLIKLQQLGSAKKSVFWIHSDLSLTPSTLLEKIIWKILALFPNVRNWLFDTDLNVAKSILIQLKPLQKSTNNNLKIAYTQAVLNFQRIAPKYKIEQDEVIPQENTVIIEITKHELLFDL